MSSTTLRDLWLAGPDGQRDSPTADGACVGRSVTGGCRPRASAENRARLNLVRGCCVASLRGCMNICCTHDEKLLATYLPEQFLVVDFCAML